MNLANLAKILIILSLLRGTGSLGQPYVGLAPSTSALSQAEALTSTARGSDCLFYNPANLANERPHLGILGVEATADRDSVERVRDYQSQDSKLVSGEDFALDEFYRKLNSDKPINLKSTARILDLVLPFFAISTIGVIKASSNRNTDSYHMNTYTDVGIIGGLGLSFMGFSLGVSRFSVLRAGLESNPSLSQFAVIDDAIKSDTFSDELLPFDEFTSFQYGSVAGTNIGALFQIFSENPSSIGIAVLNVGSANSSSKSSIKRKDFKDLETKLFTEAEKHGITVSVPEKIPQMLNVGANLAYGNSDDPLFARIACDYQDIGGDFIEHKLAIASELSLVLTDEAALASAWPFYSSDRIVYHMGLLGLRSFVSVRPSSYLSYGLGMSFHFGTQMQLSLLKLDINAFELKALSNDNSIDSGEINERDKIGVSAKLALTLIF